MVKMSEVFISYASEDRERAKQLAEILVRYGWSVFWDRKIPYGRAFDEVIEQKLEEAKCVIVLWSSVSVASRWVKAEGSEAAGRGVLIPVLLENNVKIPLEFKLMQAANLSDWQPAVHHAEPMNEARTRGGMQPKVRNENHRTN